VRSTLMAPVSRSGGVGGKAGATRRFGTRAGAVRRERRERASVAGGTAGACRGRGRGSARRGACTWGSSWAPAAGGATSRPSCRRAARRLARHAGHAGRARARGHGTRAAEWQREEGETGRRMKEEKKRGGGEKEKGRGEIGKREKERRKGKNDACQRDSRRRPWPVGHARDNCAMCEGKRGRVGVARRMAVARGRQPAERCGTGRRRGC
jgi:hypothetical protein